MSEVTPNLTVSDISIRKMLSNLVRDITIKSWKDSLDGERSHTSNNELGKDELCLNKGEGETIGIALNVAHPVPC
jgi:hypothetical protein